MLQILYHKKVIKTGIKFQKKNLNQTNPQTKKTEFPKIAVDDDDVSSSDIDEGSKSPSGYNTIYASENR